MRFVKIDYIFAPIVKFMWKIYELLSRIFILVHTHKHSYKQLSYNNNNTKQICIIEAAGKKGNIKEEKYMKGKIDGIIKNKNEQLIES